jgi:predicted nucleic acid-binding protein
MNGDEFEPLFYFDSSALAKLLLAEEAGADLAIEMWQGCSVPIASPLAFVEVCAAIALAERSGRSSPPHAALMLREWGRLWTSVCPVELTAGVAEVAGRLAKQHAVSGADAVHLASALELGSDVIFVTWDRRLHAAAGASGLAVIPATLD